MKRFIYLCTVLCTLLLSVTPVKAQKTQKNSTVTVEGIVVDENNVRYHRKCARKTDRCRNG